MDLRSVLRDIPDFPKPGILFKDITPIMEDPKAFKAAIEGMEKLLTDVSFTKLAAIESRGFIFGGPMALDMDKGLILMRKAGKLPADVYQITYALEYGEATLEMHRGALGSSDKVIIVDDLLATGGTAKAAAELVSKAGATVAGFLFMVELDFLQGRSKLEDLGPVFSLVNYS